MPQYDISARKRPVNLTLNEDLVDRVRGVTDNLSSTVEQLLAELLERSGQTLQQRQQDIASSINAWNAHGAQYGSIADEHSPL